MTLEFSRDIRYQVLFRLTFWYPFLIGLYTVNHDESRLSCGPDSLDDFVS